MLDCQLPQVELSIIIPAFYEAKNLSFLLPEVQAVLSDLGMGYEILIVIPAEDSDTSRAALSVRSAEIIQQIKSGYGGALQAGFQRARGQYILTMDADLSHPPLFIRSLWESRGQADIIVASRYIRGGSAKMPKDRFLLSRFLNFIFKFGLGLSVSDLSSGYRLYKTKVVKTESFAALDFSILQEILVRIHSAGLRIKEVPFHYAPRRSGSSNARVLRFGYSYTKMFISILANRIIRKIAS